MIEINTLCIGDVVRNIGSGTAYQVTSEPVLKCDHRGAWWSAQLTRDVECSNPQEWELIAQGPFREVKRTGDAHSITWTTRIGERELSRTVSAPTADACLWLMNKIEVADERRSMGIPSDDGEYSSWLECEAHADEVAASLNQAHNQSANVGSQG